MTDIDNVQYTVVQKLVKYIIYSTTVQLFSVYDRNDYGKVVLKLGLRKLTINHATNR